MATICDHGGRRGSRNGHHFQRHAEGLSVFYHSSIEDQRLARHAHEQIQISIPLYRNSISSGVVCDGIDVIPTFQEHATDWGGAREVVVFHFDPCFLGNAIEVPARAAERRAGRKPDHFVSQVGLMVRQELIEQSTMDDLLLVSLGTLLAGYLFSPEGLRGNGKAKTIPKLTYEQSRRAIEKMTSAGGRRLSISDISADLGLSQWHFSRQFRRTTGLSPYQFLLRWRIEKARLLLERGHPISEVAAMTGFTDQSHMHRHFRRLLGTTPGSLRRDVAERSQGWRTHGWGL
jgi:AraC family transcriptional regulator